MVLDKKAKFEYISIYEVVANDGENPSELLRNEFIWKVQVYTVTVWLLKCEMFISMKTWYN